MYDFKVGIANEYVKRRGRLSSSDCDDEKLIKLSLMHQNSAKEARKSDFDAIDIKFEKQKHGYLAMKNRQLRLKGQLEEILDVEDQSLSESSSSKAKVSMRKSKAQTNNRKTEEDKMMIDTEDGMLGS